MQRRGIRLVCKLLDTSPVKRVHPMKPKIVLLLSHSAKLARRAGIRVQVVAFDKVSELNRADFLRAALEADGLLGMGLPVQRLSCVLPTG